MGHALETYVRAARLAAGLSQEALAARAGISRQAYLAIESGRSTPSTEVALRLARALGRSVEDLFRLQDAAEEIGAELIGNVALEESVRVRLARIDERLLAWPLVGEQGVQRVLPRADGVARRGPSGEARVRLMVDPNRLNRTVVLAGCDPATALVAEHLRRRAQFELAWVNQGSRAALEALARGEAHLVGCHLRDEPSGAANMPFIQELVPFPCAVIAFAVWEEGLLVAPGNPKQLSHVEDLARADVRVANRELGSGSRALLDAELARLGVPSQYVRGYDVSLPGHLAVAEAVSLGLADAGVAVRAAANALGLDFVPLRQERYDLVVPRAHMEHPGVLALLDALKRPSLRAQVEALGGYDVADMGTPRAA